MSFVELTDFNEETKSIISGRASIARSVISKADTLIFDELLDLGIKAVPKYQKEMPERRAIPQRTQVQPQKRKISRRIRTRSRSRSNEKRPQNAVSSRRNGKESANFKSNGYPKKYQNGGSAHKPVLRSRGKIHRVRKPSVGIKVESRIFGTIGDPSPYHGY